MFFFLLHAIWCHWKPISIGEWFIYQLIVQSKVSLRKVSFHDEICFVVKPRKCMSNNNPLKFLHHVIILFFVVMNECQVVDDKAFENNVYYYATSSMTHIKINVL